MRHNASKCVEMRQNPADETVDELRDNMENFNQGEIIEDVFPDMFGGEKPIISHEIVDEELSTTDEIRIHIGDEGAR